MTAREIELSISQWLQDHPGWRVVLILVGLWVFIESVAQFVARGKKGQ